jgi:peptide/nickel transport system substrate-binding protein
MDLWTGHGAFGSFHGMSQVSSTRRKFLRVSLGAVGVIPIVSLLAACATEDDEDMPAAEPEVEADDSELEPDDETEDEDTEVEGSDEGDGEPPEGTRTDLIVGQFGEERAGFTMIWRTDVTGAQIANHLIDTLTQFEDVQTLEVAPALATDWEVEDEGMTYVFHLREGVQFHDGYGEMTAEDAEWSVNHWIEDRGRFGAMSYIDYAEQIDTYTYAVTLFLPFAGLIPVWSATGSGIHCKAAHDELGQEEYNRRGIGTGPFRLENWDPGVSVELVKNEEYWDPERPKLDRITFLPVADPFVKLERVIAEELDFIDLIDFRDIARAEQQPNLTVVSEPADNWEYIVFNLRLPDDHPVRSQQVRQAIGYAISREEIRDLVYHGHAKVVDHPFVEGFPGYSDDLNYFPLGGDPERARDLLEEAGWGDGFEIPCITSDKPVLRESLELVAAQLAEVGITVDIQFLDAGTHSERERRTFEYEMSLKDIGLSGPDTDPSVYWFHHSDLEGRETYSGVNIPEVDELLDQGRTESDPDVRHEIYQELMGHLWESSHMHWTVHPNQIWIMNSRLQGFRPGRTLFNMRLDEVYWTD